MVETSEKKKPSGRKFSLPPYSLYIVVGAIYLLISLLRFYNITAHINSVVPGADADIYGNLWDMWWVVYSVFKLHVSPFITTKLVFWPLGANMVFQTFAPIAVLLAAPLQLIGAPIAAYNTVFFLGFAISGLGMFALADYILHNKYAAFISGFIYTFSAAHITESYAYLEWRFWAWIPLGLYFFLKILHGERNYLNCLGLAACFVLAIFMANVEAGVMSLVLYAFIIAAYLLGRETRKLILRKELFMRLLISAVMVFALGFWGIIPILQLALKPSPGLLGTNLLSVANQLNSINFNMANSMDLLSFMLPSFYNGAFSKYLLTYYWKVFSIGSIERTGYLTYTLIALSIIGFVKGAKNRKLWAVMVIIFGCLALGPYIQVKGYNTHIPGPFLLYHSIPFINVIREPGRFIMIMLIAMAILAGYGYIAIQGLAKRFMEGKTISRNIVFAAIICVLIVIETSGTPITNSGGILPLTTKVSIPSFYYELGNLTENFSVMQLPALPSVRGQTVIYLAEAEYYSTASFKPLVGGWITRANYTEYQYIYYIPLAVEAKSIQDTGYATYQSPIAENYTNQTLLALYNYNVRFVTVNLAAYSAADVEQLYHYLSDTFGNPVYVSNSTIAFKTSDAIKKALFKSYVSYYVLRDWKYVPVSYNGFNYSSWSPSNGGVIVVYAPYSDPNSTELQPSGAANATISFLAASLSTGSTELQVELQAGTNRPEPIATIEVARGFKSYSVAVPGLVRGDLGNSVLFIAGNQSAYAKEYNTSDVLISDIRVSPLSH